MPTAASKRLIQVTAFSVWLILVGSTFAWLTLYGSIPGPSSDVPKSWPSSTEINRCEGQQHLLVFLHPECPCTRATLDNLQPLIRSDDLQVTLICFGDFLPQSNDSLGGCYRELQAWNDRPQVTLVSDVTGQEAERFGASTSGHCLLYDREGKLVYNGGVTSSRGHRGANTGLSILKSTLNELDSAESSYPVFGCPLLEKKPEDLPLDSPPSLDPPECCEGRFHA